jgi:DUF1707 SHOCT-like domain
MLLGDAEREQLYETLKRHAAEGRLDIAELERRVALVAGAETREEAAVALADLPALAGASEPARRPRRGRGHGEVDKPGPDWQPTSERFRDPRTRRVLRVWVDPAGERHYVAE